MLLPLTLSKQVLQYDWIVQQEKGKREQIMTLDEVTMLWYLEGHQKMEDWSAPMDAFILYQWNSNNQLLRQLDVELLKQENALMTLFITKVFTPTKRRNNMQEKDCNMQRRIYCCNRVVGTVSLSMMLEDCEVFRVSIRPAEK